MNLKYIQNKVLSISKYVKSIEIIKKDAKLHALIVPELERLKQDSIINIKEEIRWYGVELYNLEASDDKKIHSFEIVLPKTEISDMECDDVCIVLKEFLSTLSDKKIYPSSHLELDIGLDSLNYVELFIFIEQSFGVKIDESIFSKMMYFKELFEYVKKNKKFFKKQQVNWENILNAKIDKKLIYSPFIMFIYKFFLYPVFRLYFALKVKGLENIPNGQCIIAPTHQSMLDGFLVESTLPFKALKNSFFLVYKQVFGTWFFKFFSKHGQSILIDANENLICSMRYSALPLKEGNNLVVFPEGARSRDRKLLEFRPFFAILSKIYDIPIVPVVIDGSFEALGCGKVVPRPEKISITYLKPIYPDDLNIEEIVKKVKKAAQNELYKSVA